MHGDHDTRSGQRLVESTRPDRRPMHCVRQLLPRLLIRFHREAVLHFGHAFHVARQFLGAGFLFGGADPTG